jgi:hypothetical protein
MNHKPFLYGSLNITQVSLSRGLDKKGPLSDLPAEQLFAEILFSQKITVSKYGRNTDL